MSKPRRVQPSLVLSILKKVSAQVTPIYGEAVTIPAGGAGTFQNFGFAQGPIANAAGNEVAGYGDTSLVLTSTAFTREVAANTEDSALANGDFWVDYVTGQARGKKADTSTTATAVYKAFTMKLMSDPFDDLVTVTPADGTDLPNGICRGLYCTAAGDVVVITANGTTQTIPVDKYQIFPGRFKRIKATGTTATVLAGY